VGEFLLLFRRFLRQPRTVGAVAPSSPVLAREMIRGLDLGGASRLVELGPGTGAFTRALVGQMGPSAVLLAIELEPEFATQIRQRWPSVDCVCSSAEQLESLVRERHLLPVDHIISGLPFASLPRDVTRGILDGIERVLKPGGTFTTFQYVHAYGLPPAIAFRHDLHARFGAGPARSVVVRNIPPAWVLRWTRGQSSAGDRC
jgi:phosphatidylethanolamine/phosphatidyl-N-methylethanolamine N-methyltransferase